MYIYGIKAKSVMACAGSWAEVAEASVGLPDGSEVYVLAQEFDTTELTVSKQSLYSFLAEDGSEPAVEFVEEYTAWKDAKGSEYWPVFEKLKKVIKMLG
jgi:hypothetical protein